MAIGCWLSVPAACPLAAQSEPSPSSPFLNLRQATLGYHGPAGEFTNLTEVRIGWFGPTNLADPLTGDLWWAANLAVREANARSSDFGLRTSDFASLPYRLIPRWSVDPWGTGVSQLTRMVYDEQPLALLGSVDSASTHLAEQVVAKANLALVSPLATDGTATLAGVPWMFACAPSDRAVATSLVAAVIEELRGAAGGLALLATTDHASRMTTAAVRQELSRRGRLPDFQFSVTPGATDLRQQTDALVAARPTVIIIIAGAEDAARLVVAVRTARPDTALFGGPETGRQRFRELVGAAGEGVWFPELIQPDPTDAEWIRFRTRFLAERGRAPDHAAVLTYDATRLLLEASCRAGPNRARLREMLAQLSPWAGLGGEIAFDGTGQNTRANLRMTRLLVPSSSASSSSSSSSSSFPPPAVTNPSWPTKSGAEAHALQTLRDPGCRPRTAHGVWSAPVHRRCS